MCGWWMTACEAVTCVDGGWLSVGQLYAWIVGG